uniref:Uncharacterized protein n=1 Tax=viral metagenome TaxID=1070528 RepID=A0A6M3JLU6_9ZZZZ
MAKITLKKVFKEVYTKKRGSARSEFTGHSTDYFIDGVPVQKKGWDTRIQSIIDEETFKLLTSPTYFNSLHWQKRREILLSMCGDVSDEEVIESDGQLADLPGILGWKSPEEAASDAAKYLTKSVDTGEMSPGVAAAFVRNKFLNAPRTIDDHRKIVAARKKAINDRLKEIPARIDELNKSIAEASTHYPLIINAEIKRLADLIQAAGDDAGLSTLRKEKAEAGALLSEAIAKHAKLKREVEFAHDTKLKAIENYIALNVRDRQTSESNIVRLDGIIRRDVAELDRLRAEYGRIAGEKFDGENVCPTCGQDLPEDQIQAATDRHNQEKARRLTQINETGKELRATCDLNQAEKADLEARVEKLAAEAKTLGADLQKAESAKTVALGKLTDTARDEVAKIQAEIAAILARMDDYTETDTTGLEAEKLAQETKLAEIEAARKTRIRIIELSDEEKNLAGEYEELERQTFLMERFIVAKVGLLESKINSRFELARFKMFEVQINGGISECCTTLFNGVPWGSGLNTGAEINVGLDIVKTLSEHYGVKAPIFIDHAESVTEIYDPGTQTIKLHVDEACKQLEVVND